MASTDPITPAECYRCWTAWEGLLEAAEITNYRSVWALLACDCCPEPHRWQSMKILSVPHNLQARIRWYDNVQLPIVSTDGSGTCDSSDESSSPRTPALPAERLRQVQSHFVSHHQRIELVLHCLKPNLDRIYGLLKAYKRNNSNNMRDIPNELVKAVVSECKCVANGWYAVGFLVRGVALMDRMDYLAYVPRLAGVSGGNSPLMMSLTAKTANMESLLSMSNKDGDGDGDGVGASKCTTMSLEELALEIHQKSPLGRLAEAFIDCLDSVSRCWFEHVVTAITVIGITKGTKGTPNTILVERVLKRLQNSNLLVALGRLREPLSGIGVEMHQLCDYSKYPLANHYLDVFVDPGPEFGSHRVGWLPKEYELARNDFVKLRRSQRTAIWEHFYTETRPAFCRELSRLLGVNGSSGGDDHHGKVVAFGLGSSMTAVLSRLVASIQMVANCRAIKVVLADDEFVTMQRTAAILGRGGASIQRVAAEELGDHATHIEPNTLFSGEDEKKDERPVIRKMIFVSLVNSCNQRIQEMDWARSVPEDVVVVVDITQAIGNIPLTPLGVERLASHPNFFLVGSMIKHARCGENLGFMTYSTGADRLLKEPASGWTAFCSGLRANTTADFSSNKLYYDDGIEWDGGTPAWVEASYVATRILRTMPSVERQHAYVKDIQALFLKKAAHLLDAKQIANVSDSNTLAIPVSTVTSAVLPFGLDYKVVNGQSYLRIGFGVHNLEYHLGELLQFLEQRKLLK